MICLLLLLACESAEPLPPPTRTQSPPGQMVKVGPVSGLLVAGKGSSEAVLLLVDDLGEATQSQVRQFFPSPALAITPATDIMAATRYLASFEGIKTVTPHCQRMDCTDINIAATQSMLPAHQAPLKPSQP